MRLVTYRRDGRMLPGALVDGGVVDLSTRLDVRSIKEIILRDRLAEAAAAAADAADHALDEATLDLPMPDAGRIFCVGVNYMNRNKEYRDGSEAPRYPSLFMRSPSSLVPHGQPVIIPRESEQLDYEGEIVLVIGRTGRRIAPDDAIAHVAGLSIMNEGSVRDWLRHGKFNVTQGKNFDRSGSMGPWIETDFSAIDVTDMRVETRVNGQVRQSDTTASMAFPFARLLEYISTFTALMPGDLVATGTPAGAGARFDPPRWLKPGDVVEIEVAGVGTLRNMVQAEGVRPPGVAV